MRTQVNGSKLMHGEVRSVASPSPGRDSLTTRDSSPETVEEMSKSFPRRRRKLQEIGREPRTTPL